MDEYTVTWVIQVSADSPEEAARRAKAKMQNPDTIADVFGVTTPGGDEVVIDLSMIDGRLID